MFCAITLHIIQKKMNKRYFFLLLIQVLIIRLSAQNLPLTSRSTNYSPQEYMADAQNWSINQSPDGTLFFGNNQGLLVKEGQNWRLFSMHNQIVRAVLFHDNKVYVGGGKEFGYFIKTAFGNYRYHSLAKNLAKDWGEIWEIYVIGNFVYFRSGNSIFKFDEKNDNLIYRKLFKEVVFSKKLNNKIIAQILGKGVVILNVDLEIDEVWANGTDIDKITIRNVEVIEGEYYFFTLSNGILRLRNKTLKKVPCKIQQQLEIAQIYCSMKVDDRLIIGTVLDGMYVLNKELEVESHYNSEKRLRNNTILSLYADATKNIWAGLDNGISFIYIDSPFSYFSFDKKIGTGYSYVRSGSYNYWGTNQGLYYTVGNSPKINLIPKTQGQVWSLYEIGSAVYCGHHNGLYKVQKGQAELIDSHRGIFTLNRLSNTSAFYLALSYRGLLLFHLERDNLIFIDKVDSQKIIPNKVKRDKAGSFWFQTTDGFSRFKIDTVACSIKTFQTFDFPNPNKSILSLQDTLFFFHNKNFYLFNNQKNEFQKTDIPKINNADFGIKALFDFHEDMLKELFLSSEHTFLSLLSAKPFLRPCITDRISKIDENYLLNSYEGFVCFDSKFSAKSDTFSLNTFIYKIEYKELDSTRYAFPTNNALKYRQNSVRFQFATNDYRNSISYQYRLVGLNKRFSSTKEELKEYVNLFEGDYRFEVFAQNHFGEKSSIASYSFTILPPWYRTLYAYLLYALLMLTVLFFVFKSIQRSFLRKEKHLREQKRKEISALHQKQKIDKLNHENEIMLMEQEHLKNKIHRNEQELVNATRNTIQRNDFLLEIKNTLSTIKQETDIEKRNRHIRKLLWLIESSLNTEKDWEVFEFYFNEIHQNFFQSLKTEFPTLTSTELKLCAYIRLNKSSKEIASLMNISLRGVETGRYRLRKKLGLSRDTSFFDVFMAIEKNKSIKNRKESE